MFNICSNVNSALIFDLSCHKIFTNISILEMIIILSWSLVTWCSQCVPLSVGPLHLQRPSLYLVPGVVNFPFLVFSQYCDISPLWNIVPYRTCATESLTVSKEKMKKPAHVCKIYDGTSKSQNLSLKLEIHDSLHHLHFITYWIILLLASLCRRGQFRCGDGLCVEQSRC